MLYLKKHIVINHDKSTGCTTITKTAVISLYKPNHSKSERGMFASGGGRGVSCLTHTDGAPSGEAIIFMRALDGQRYIVPYTRLIQSANGLHQICEWARGSKSHHLDVDKPVTTKKGLAAIAEVDPDGKCIGWLVKYGFIRLVDGIWTISPLYSLTSVHTYQYSYVKAWQDQFRLIYRGSMLEALQGFLACEETLENVSNPQVCQASDENFPDEPKDENLYIDCADINIFTSATSCHNSERIKDIQQGTFDSFEVPTETKQLTSQEFYAAAKEINLSQFLGLPYSENEHFNCLLPDHADDAKSAWLVHYSTTYGNRENGWRYHCSCCSKGYDLIDLITIIRAGHGKVYDSSEKRRTYNFVKKVMNWKVTPYDC